MSILPHHIPLLDMAATAWRDIFTGESGRDKLAASERYDVVAKMLSLPTIRAKKGEFYMNMRPDQVWRVIHKDRSDPIEKFPNAKPEKINPVEDIKRFCEMGYSVKDLIKMGYNHNTVRKFYLIHKRKLNEQQQSAS